MFIVPNLNFRPSRRAVSRVAGLPQCVFCRGFPLLLVCWVFFLFAYYVLLQVTWSQPFEHHHPESTVLCSYWKPAMTDVATNAPQAQAPPPVAQHLGMFPFTPQLYGCILIIVSLCCVLFVPSSPSQRASNWKMLS